MTKVSDIKIQAENICFKAYVHVWASLLSPKNLLKLFSNYNQIWQCYWVSTGSIKTVSSKAVTPIKASA